MSTAGCSANFTAIENYLKSLSVKSNGVWQVENVIKALLRSKFDVNISDNINHLFGLQCCSETCQGECNPLHRSEIVSTLVGIVRNYMLLFITLESGSITEYLTSIVENVDWSVDGSLLTGHQVSERVCSFTEWFIHMFDNLAIYDGKLFVGDKEFRYNPNKWEKRVCRDVVASDDAKRRIQYDIKNFVTDTAFFGGPICSNSDYYFEMIDNAIQVCISLARGGFEIGKMYPREIIPFLGFCDRSDFSVALEFSCPIVLQTLKGNADAKISMAFNPADK